MVALQIIDELESLLENSRGGLLGKRLINETKFFSKILQLRAALPNLGKALSLIEELEQLVKNSKIRFSGQRLISEEEFFIKIQQLRSVLKIHAKS